MPAASSAAGSAGTGVTSRVASGVATGSLGAGEGLPGSRGRPRRASGDVAGAMARAMRPGRARRRRPAPSGAAMPRDRAESGDRDGAGESAGGEAGSPVAVGDWTGSVVGTGDASGLGRCDGRPEVHRDRVDGVLAHDHRGAAIVRQDHRRRLHVERGDRAGVAVERAAGRRLGARADLADLGARDHVPAVGSAAHPGDRLRVDDDRRRRPGRRLPAGCAVAAGAPSGAASGPTSRATIATAVRPANARRGDRAGPRPATRLLRRARRPADLVVERQRDPGTQVARRRRQVLAQPVQELGVGRERPDHLEARVAAGEVLVEPGGVRGVERAQQGLGGELLRAGVRVVEPVRVADDALEAAHRRTSLDASCRACASRRPHARRSPRSPPRGRDGGSRARG